MSEDKDSLPGGLYDKLAEAAAQMENTFYEPVYIYVPDWQYDEMQLLGFNMSKIRRMGFNWSGQTTVIVEEAANIKAATGPNIEKLIRDLSGLDTATFSASGMVMHPSVWRKFLPWIKGRNMVKRLKRKRERSLWGLCKRYGLPSLLLNPTHRNT